MTDENIAVSSNPGAHVRRLCDLAEALNDRGGGWQAEVDNLRMAGDELTRLDIENMRLRAALERIGYPERGMRPADQKEFLKGYVPKHVRIAQETLAGLPVETKAIPRSVSAENRLRTNIDMLRSLIGFAYEQGYHEHGFDVLGEVLTQLGYSPENGDEQR